ncbi:MAG: hypothetical protein JWO02_3639, partial [Solirubrobacterales bacterium]|nr:hypothetical protein [Solirubrobacterales bacterium]
EEARGTAVGASGPPWPDFRPMAPEPMPLRRALAWGLAASVVLGFIFALRAGVVLGPLVALVLWRGLADRLLLSVAGAILVVVAPAVYVVRNLTLDDPGGFDTAYATARIWGHWPAVAAVTLLGFVLIRTLRRPRPRPGSPAAPTGKLNHGSGTAEVTEPAFAAPAPQRES